MDVMEQILREVLGLPVITEEEIAVLNEALEAGGAETFSTWAAQNPDKLRAAYVTLDKQGFTASSLGDQETATQVSITMVIFAVYARRLGFTLEGPHSAALPDAVLAEADSKVVA